MIGNASAPENGTPDSTGKPVIKKLSERRHLSKSRASTIDGRGVSSIGEDASMEFDIGRAVLGGLVGTIAPADERGVPQ